MGWIDGWAEGRLKGGLVEGTAASSHSLIVHFVSFDALFAAVVSILLLFFFYL